MQYRSPVTPDGLIWAAAQPTADLGVDPLAPPARHGDVTGEGVKQLDMAIGIIGALPVEMPHVEQAALLDVRRSLLPFAWAGASGVISVSQLGAL
jgi:hypothetical protein